MIPFRDFVAQAIVDATRKTQPENGKIDAIRQLRSATGLGLKASKDLVEAWDDEKRGSTFTSILNVALDLVDSLLPEKPLAPIVPKPEPEAIVVLGEGRENYKAEDLNEAERFAAWVASDTPYFKPKIFVEQV